ncbi:MAG: hypothetical protein H6741_26825 [Alphaproteobacteria bacterium]|nr:hypothetical protein [Alphaproteobacteria bacterium]
MRPTLIALLLLAVGCKKPVEAPAEVEELSSFLFMEWDNEDPAVMEAGLVNLLAIADGLDLSAEVEERAFTVQGGISREEVEAYVEHDFDPQDTDAVGIFYRSPYSVAEHMLHVALTDRTMVEPSSPNIYNREWIQGEPQALLAEDFEIINAMNDVERENFLFELRFDLDKYWRVVRTPDGEQAVFARSFNVDSCDNGGNISLLHAYSVDVFVPDGDGTVRFQAAWQRTEMPGLDDSDIAGALVDGIEGAFVMMDDWLEVNR